LATHAHEDARSLPSALRRLDGGIVSGCPPHPHPRPRLALLEPHPSAEIAHGPVKVAAGGSEGSRASRPGPLD
jgi:hypothetical protein